MLKLNKIFYVTFLLLLWTMVCACLLGRQGLWAIAFAQEESVTITTYYPSPYGSYNELETYSDTHLAIQSGNVGIGTTNPQGKLDLYGPLAVTGNPGTLGQVLMSQGSALPPIWSSGGGPVRVVSGTSCPAGYSPVSYYYQSRVCVGFGGALATSCTTPAMWGPAIQQICWVYPAMPTQIECASLRAQCIYRNQGAFATLYPQICEATVILRTLCATDNP